MQYKRVTVSTCSEFADTLSVLLIDYGSEGVSVVDAADVRRTLCEHNWDYADESLLQPLDETVYVTACYAADFDLCALSEQLAALRASGQKTGPLEIDVSTLDSASYENEWKKYYTPIKVGDMVVVPAWLDYENKQNKRILRLDPGMAFGTGNHETTRLCLELMQRVPLEGRTVADVGCGSGILGAAALVLGAAHCIMIDTDPQAVEASERNCVLGGVRERATVVQGTLEQNSGSFDLILANITADVLAAILPAAHACLQSGGFMVTSGIIHAKSAFVRETYAQFFDLKEHRIDGEWEAMLWQKR